MMNNNLEAVRLIHIEKVEKERLANEARDSKRFKDNAKWRAMTDEERFKCTCIWEASTNMNRVKNGFEYTDNPEILEVYEKIKIQWDILDRLYVKLGAHMLVQTVASSTRVLEEKAQKEKDKLAYFELLANEKIF